MCIITIYVNELIVMRDSEEKVDYAKDLLKMMFDMKVLGELLLY